MDIQIPNNNIIKIKDLYKILEKKIIKIIK